MINEKYKILSVKNILYNKLYHKYNFIFFYTDKNKNNFKLVFNQSKYRSRDKYCKYIFDLVLQVGVVSFYEIIIIIQIIVLGPVKTLRGKKRM